MVCYGKTTTAEEQTKLKEAEQILKTKISECYINNKGQPTLQQLADYLCDDDEIEYVIADEKTASIEHITVRDSDNIFVKLKEYIYEFEIDENIEIASIIDVNVKYAKGDGSEENPFIISNKEDFNKFIKKVNNGNNYQGKYVKLESDLDYTNDNSFKAISSFKGDFDGQNHKIIGISSTNLFTSLNGANVKNLTIKDSVLTSSGQIGGIAGYATNSTIENCINDNSSVKIYSSLSAVGGIVGYASNCTIRNCINGGQVWYSSTSGNSSGYVAVGGILGEGKNNTLIEKCRNTGAVLSGGSTNSSRRCGWNSWTYGIWKCKRML